MSQEIPDDWQEQSRVFSRHVQDFFRKNNVDVVVCADQTFVKYLLAKEDLLVPSGIRRVGTTMEGLNERKGVSLMLYRLSYGIR